MLKVVIVEDEPILLKGLLYRIDWLKTGCTVIGSAEDGNEGLRLISELRPDLVITDIRMPFKDGLEMLKEAKCHYQFEAIILSGFGEFAYAQQAIHIGVHDYLLKPVDLNELEATLRKVVTILNEKKSAASWSEHTKVYADILDIDLESASGYVGDTMRIIKARYGEKLTMREVSDELCISSVTLNAKLKQNTGYGFNELLTRYRITKALGLLQDEKMLVYEIAEQTGFSDYKYFSHVFKKHTGMSPKQFLKKT
ncbi:response regulator [Bacillus sp. JCM 19041]|uniref:response regulator transcription factor n=1 Tax=Bacillus sp. JCM 19041 TaxID=1460637 RepID=UPI0006CF4C19